MTAGPDEHYYIQPHPFHKRGHQIYKIARGSEGYPVGEYIVMDKDEPRDVTLKKLDSLTASLNNKIFATPEKQADRQLVSFQRVGARHDTHVPEQIIFYKNHKGETGETRREVNAVLTFSKGEIDQQGKTIS